LNPDTVVVKEGGVLETARREARAARHIGFDSEFLRERTYRARLCLVQIATPDTVYLVDPLEVDPSPLAELIADPAVE
jgi:ribonuclease D